MELVQHFGQVYPVYMHIYLGRGDALGLAGIGSGDRGLVCRCAEQGDADPGFCAGAR